MEIVIAWIAALAGLLVGGLINILADDLPHRQVPRRPHYPDGTPRPAVAWLGIAAFVGGRREPPGAAAQSVPVVPEADPAALPGDVPPADPPPPRRLGWRHPLTEIVTALGFAGLALGFGGEKNLPAWFVYLAVLLLITVIDLEHRLILLVVVLPASLFALGVAAVSPEGGKPFSDFLIGGLVGFGLFFLMFLGGALFSAAVDAREVAFGFGDVMLAALSGFMIGWRAFIFAALITVFVGAAGALLYMLIKALLGRRHRWFTPLPYGPYIVIGTLIMLLFREDVQRLLQGG